MQIIRIEKNDAGQRADKFLSKYLSKAPKSFIYKMMRKKIITLYTKTMTGSEPLTGFQRSKNTGMKTPGTL